MTQGLRWRAIALSVCVVAATSTARAQSDASAPSTDGGAAPSSDASATDAASPSSAEPSADAGSADASAEGGAVSAGEAMGPAAGSDAGAGDGGAEPAEPLDSDTLVRQLTPAQQARLVPSQGDLADRDDSAPHRFVLPPYLYEWGRSHHTRVVFPFYFENRVGDSTGWLVPPYYRFRSPRAQSDVFLPLYFRFRGQPAEGQSWATDIVPPFWLYRGQGPGRSHYMGTGVFPLFGYSEHFGENGRLRAEVLVIPPLLTYHRWWPRGQTTVAGPFVYVRNGINIDWLLFPLVFHHSDANTRWTLIPPLLFFHRRNFETNRSLTVVGPFFTEVGQDSLSLNLAPLFFHYHDRERSRTTLFPLFHVDSGPSHFTFISPLAGYTRNGDATTLILPLYQQHRGQTLVDSFFPVPLLYARNPSLGWSTVVAGPFAHTQSPQGYSWGLFPFVLRSHGYDRYDTVATPLFVHSRNFASRVNTTWVFPTFHAEQGPDYRFFNFYPFIYTAAGRNWHHNIVFPFVWDIGNTERRTQLTMVLPFFARSSNRDGFTQWVFPAHVYWESNRDGERAFGWDFNGIVQYGEPRRGDYYWSVFEGLVGYYRQGSYARMRLFWAAFPVSGPSNNAPAANNAPRARADGQGYVLDL